VYCFNVESEAELEILSQVAVETGKTAAISLRVNPDVDAQTHPYISTGLKQNKFGIDIDRAIAVFQRAAELPNIKVSGIDCHIGSQLTTVTPFMDAMDRLLERIDQLAANGIHIEHVDIGGGLGVRYRDEQPPAPADYVSALLAKLGDRKLKVVMEPGRAIAANAGIMVTEVQLLKSTEIKNFVVVDAAMNDMIRPSLYSAWQDIIPVQPTHQGEAALCDVVGPVCETGDFLGKDRELNVKAGDLLAVCSAGAYGFVMSSNYNTRNRAPEVMVDDDRFHIIRRRETYEDQFALESLVP
ncbi:MAG: diaminopimelate decarboxylase, partial [Ketobacter sp.]